MVEQECCFILVCRWMEVLYIVLLMKNTSALRCRVTEGREVRAHRCLRDGESEQHGEREDRMV